MSKKKEAAENLIKKETLKEFEKIRKSIIEKIKEIITKAKSKKNFRIACITHNNCDADATSSLAALKKTFRDKDVRPENVELFANGNPTRESKVIADKIGISIKPLKDFNKKKYKAVILIDAASINQTNLTLKNGEEPDLIIDHHNEEDPFGATATVMTLLMTALNVEIEHDLAAALAIGIDIDTNNRTSKKFTDFDELAYYRILSPLINHQLYVEIVKRGHGYSDSYQEMLDNAISKPYYHQEGTTVISSVGYIKLNQRTEDLPKVANFLLAKDGVEKVVVLAIVESEERDKEENIVAYKKSIIPIVRSSTSTQSAGELSKLVFGEKRAGGDTAKASGEVPLKAEKIKDIERAKKYENDIALKGYVIDFLCMYKDKILEEQTS